MNKLHFYFRNVSVFAIFLLVVASSVWFNANQGVLVSTESYKYLAHYLSQRSFPEKIYDFRGNDVMAPDTYRARDLSNVTNWLDAQLVLLQLRLGFGGYISAIHYFVTGVFVFLLIWFARKYHGSSSFALSALMGLVFLTSPGVYLAGNYFRTSKSLITLLIMLDYWFLWGLALKKLKPGLASLMVLFSVTIALVITDEIGLAFSAGFLMVTILLFFFQKIKNMLPVIFTQLLALGLSLIYRSVISPWLVYKVTGIWPKLFSPELGQLFNPDIIGETIRTYLGYVSALLGNTGIPVAGSIFLLLLFVLFTAGGNTENRIARRNILKWNYLVMIAVSLITVMLMIATHPPITHWENIIRYYSLPFHAYMTIVLGSILIEITGSIEKYRYFPVMILSAIVLLNLTSLPAHYRYVTQMADRDHWNYVQDFTAAVYSGEPVNNIDPGINPWVLDAITVARKRLRLPQ